MNKILQTLGLGIVFALGGCASLTTDSEVADEVALANNQIPADWLLPLPTDLSAPKAWSQIYNDPLLETYLMRAASQSFDIRIARTRIDEAQANLRRAQSQLMPRLNGSLSASGSALLGDIGDIADTFGAGISGSWNPDIFGQTQAGIDGSGASLAVQEALAEDTRQRILAQTARAYIRAVEAGMQVELARINLEFLTESRRISEARYRAGDTAKGDYSFAEANFQSALSSYENTKQSARTARRALSIVLGDFPVEDIALDDDLGTPLMLPPRSLPANVLENRPDIIAARAQIAGRLASLRSAEANDWPRVSITGGLSGGSAFKNLFDPSDYVARLGASLAANLFDGGANDAAQHAARASLDASLLAYEQQLRSAISEISNAYDRAETLQRTLVFLEAASTSANEALRLESIQYDLGESSLLDVLQVQQRVNSIDVSLVRTKASLLENTITAFETIGGF